VNLTRQELADQAASLAVEGVYIGTSSWKYPVLSENSRIRLEITKI
jgi:hypothetical protein